MGWVVNATPGRFIPKRDPAPIVQEAVWATDMVVTGTQHLAATAIRSPDRQSRRESLYRLSYSRPRYTFNSVCNL
jgi:hypothetical protein